MGKRYEISLNSSDMFRFQLQHAFTSFQGLLTVALSLVGLVLLITKWELLGPTYQILLIIVALYGPVLEPVRLFFRSRKQASQPMFTKPIGYEFEEEGVILTQDEERVVIPWAAVYKVVRAKDALYMYVNRVRGYILPDECLEGDKKAIADYIDARKGAGR